MAAVKMPFSQVQAALKLRNRLDEAVRTLQQSQLESFRAKCRSIMLTILAPWPEVGTLSRIGRIITFFEVCLFTAMAQPLGKAAIWLHGILKERISAPK